MAMVPRKFRERNVFLSPEGGNFGNKDFRTTPMCQVDVDSSKHNSEKIVAHMVCRVRVDDRWLDL